MIDEVCRPKRRVFLCRQSMRRRFSVKVNRRKIASLFSLLDSMSRIVFEAAIEPRNLCLLQVVGRPQELSQQTEVSCVL